MEDNIKQLSSYQQDQEILDARGIEITVAEVAGLATCKYAARLRQLKISDEDRALLKSMRRRIKNRMASQNSRRRSVEHLRRLTRELRAVRACRSDALAERRVLIAARDRARDACERLREHLCQILEKRADPTEVPTIDVEITKPHTPKDTAISPKDIACNATVSETKTTIHPECCKEQKIERDKSIFECRLDKLVQQSVNHIYKDDLSDKKKIFAKTVFISNEKHSSDVKNVIFKTEFESDDELRLKEIKKEFDIFDDFDNNEDNDELKKEFCDHNDDVKNENKDYVKNEDLKSNIKTESVIKTTLKIPDVSKRIIQRNIKVNGDTKIHDILNDKLKTQTVYKSEIKIPNLTNGGVKSHEISKCTIFNGNMETNDIFNRMTKIEEVFNKKTNGKVSHVSIEDILKSNEKVQDAPNTTVDVQGVGGKADIQGGVLNLCVKRRSHGRKQSAPRRIAYACVDDDVVLDLKIKKEPQ